jgi:hypothetical protein
LSQALETDTHTAIVARNLKKYLPSFGEQGPGLLQFGGAFKVISKLKQSPLNFLCKTGKDFSFLIQRLTCSG